MGVRTCAIYTKRNCIWRQSRTHLKTLWQKCGCQTYVGDFVCVCMCANNTYHSFSIWRQFRIRLETLWHTGVFEFVCVILYVCICATNTHHSFNFWRKIHARFEALWQTGVYIFLCAAVCCSVLQCVAVCCSVLQCIVVCCVFVCVPRTHFVQLFTPISYLVGDAATSHVRTTNHEHDEIPSNGTHIAVCCSELQCVAVCCNVLQWVAMFCRHDEIPSDVTHIAVCCSMLQCVAVGCSGLQLVMVWWVVLLCVSVL